MEIVLLCTKYSTESDSPTLADELANAFVHLGHTVTAFVVDWSGESTSPEVELISFGGVQVYKVSSLSFSSYPAIAQKSFKWLFSSMALIRCLRGHLSAKSVNVVVGFSPAIAMAIPVLLTSAAKGIKSFLVQWDFFPDHQSQIGLLRGRQFVTLLKFMENFLMRRFDVIGCMSPMNIQYLEKGYRLRERQKVVHLPIWTSRPKFFRAPREDTRVRYGLPLGPVIFVFGGQLVAGRGVEDILEVAKRAQESTVNCHFVFVGNGSLKKNIDDYVALGGKNAMVLPPVSRLDYLSMLSACDVGIVSTVRGVSVPTFPSKSLDYLHADLPILASVEQSTDFGQFIVANGVGLCVEAGDIEGFYKAILRFLDEPNLTREMSARCQSVINENFDVKKIAKEMSQFFSTN